MAHHPTHAEQDRTLTKQAAELGLAKAVLAWQHPDDRAFTAFAHAAIQAQINQIPTAAAATDTDPLTSTV